MYFRTCVIYIYIYVHTYIHAKCLGIPAVFFYSHTSSLGSVKNKKKCWKSVAGAKVLVHLISPLGVYSTKTTFPHLV